MTTVVLSVQCRKPHDVYVATCTNMNVYVHVRMYVHSIRTYICIHIYNLLTIAQQ